MWKALFRTHNTIPLGLVRLALGVVIFSHGAQKMLGWWGGAGFTVTLAGFGHRFGTPLAFLAICAEFFGGLGLILGFLSRIAAFGVLCNMAFAIATLNYRFGFFANWSGKQKGEGFEFHILAIAMALAVIVGGGGALSIDGLLFRATGQGVGRSRQPAERLA
jgi:putative oxidoreductase